MKSPKNVLDSVSVLRSPPSMDHGAKGPPETNLTPDPYFT